MVRLLGCGAPRPARPPMERLHAVQAVVRRHAAHARGDLGPAGAPVAVPDVVGRPEVAARRPAASDTSPWRSAGMQKAPTEVQNSTATILVDLRGEEDGIIASFKPKCRYNIRLAARRGVVVHRLPVTDATIDVMYRLMRETQVR